MFSDKGTLCTTNILHRLSRLIRKRPARQFTVLGSIHQVPILKTGTRNIQPVKGKRALRSIGVNKGKYDFCKTIREIKGTSWLSGSSGKKGKSCKTTQKSTIR